MWLNLFEGMPGCVKSGVITLQTNARRNQTTASLRVAGLS
jgi:hypothetical protein